MFLIQGCFFQNQQWLGTRMVPRAGLVPVVEEGLIYSMYAGLITVDRKRPGSFRGGMADHFGESRLSDIVLTADELSFTKQYVTRTDAISYKFVHRDGSAWAGTYQGSAVGKGTTRCIVTEVADDFNDPRRLLGILGLRSAHTWK